MSLQSTYVKNSGSPIRAATDAFGMQDANNKFFTDTLNMHNNQFANNNSQLSNHKKRLNNQQDSISRHGKSITQHTKEISQVRKQYQQQQKLISQMQKTIQALTKRLAALETTNAKLMKTVQTVNVVTKQLKQQNATQARKQEVVKTRLEQKVQNLEIRMKSAEFQLMHRDEDSSAPPSRFLSEVETDSSEESEDIEGDLRNLAESLKFNNQNKK